MSSRYDPNSGMRVVNRIFVELLKAGCPLPVVQLLATKGRRSGRIRLTPVIPVTDGNQRWLVAPYGESNWVKNLRANHRLQLRNGPRVIYGQAMATSDEEAGAIFREYLQKVPFIRQYVDIPHDAPLETFILNARRYPVFRVIERGNDR